MATLATHLLRVVTGGLAIQVKTDLGAGNDVLP
jgi:hypothetical protein